jgi:hypothetical protein
MRTDNKFNKFCKNPGDLYDPGAIIFGAGHEGCEVDGAAPGESVQSFRDIDYQYAQSGLLHQHRGQ